MSSSSDTKSFSPPKQFIPHLNLHEAITNLQTHFNGFLHHHLHGAKTVFDAGFSRFSSCSLPSSGNRVFARIGEAVSNQVQNRGPMSADDIEERLGGVPVYALSNANDEFVLISGGPMKKTKSLALMCFKEEDAAAILQHMEKTKPLGRTEASKVVPVALNKIVNLKVDGVAFRLIPDPTQVKNALKVIKRDGYQEEDGFSGVPVFQSRSLVLQSQNKKYRPVFFRKEDLDTSLARASRHQNKLNPAIRGDIQVAVFEDIIKGMKEGRATWDDIVFIPPGLEVSTEPMRNQLR